MEQYLRQEGQERYIKAEDNFNSFRSILKFIWGVFAQGNEITISLGQPLDVLGNRVEPTGRSYTKSGRLVSTREYFRDQNGVINTDHQRESEYTRMLGEKIVERYHADGIVLPSHIASYAAFAIVEKANIGTDLYGIMRLPAEEFYFDQPSLLNVIGQLRDQLLSMSNEDRAKVSPELYESPEAILRHAIASIGNFHIQKPLRRDGDGNIVCDSYAMLFYYHNRLSTFKLKGKVRYPKELIHQFAARK